MVSYYSAGTQWAVAKGNPKNVNIDDACGMTVGVQKGTVQLEDLAARSKKCTDAGKPAIMQVIQTGPGPGRPPTSSAARRTRCSPTPRSARTP